MAVATTSPWHRSSILAAKAATTVRRVRCAETRLQNRTLKPAPPSPPSPGPMNSWDRMPFLTTIKSGGYEATYSAALTETHHSMIIANYGASQGFDNDDGSSWYDTHDNFFYDASGFKMVRFDANHICALYNHAPQKSNPNPNPTPPKPQPNRTTAATTAFFTPTLSSPRRAKTVWGRRPLSRGTQRRFSTMTASCTARSAWTTCSRIAMGTCPPKGLTLSAATTTASTLRRQTRVRRATAAGSGPSACYQRGLRTTSRPLFCRRATPSSPGVAQSSFCKCATLDA